MDFTNPHVPYRARRIPEVTPQSNTVLTEEFERLQRTLDAMAKRIDELNAGKEDVP